MWWVLQLIAMMLVTGVLAFARWFSQTHPGAGIFIPWITKILNEFLAAFCFIKSYALAPTFFQPWFLGTAGMAIFGFILSLILFSEVLTITKIVGAALAVIGAVLLVI